MAGMRRRRTRAAPGSRAGGAGSRPRRPNAKLAEEDASGRRKLEDQKKTQTEICKVTGLTEVTLRKVATPLSLKPPLYLPPLLSCAQVSRGVLARRYRKKKERKKSQEEKKRKKDVLVCDPRTHRNPDRKAKVLTVTERMRKGLQGTALRALENYTSHLRVQGLALRL